MDPAESGKGMNTRFPDYFFLKLCINFNTVTRLLQESLVSIKVWTKLKNQYASF